MVAIKQFLNILLSKLNTFVTGICMLLIAIMVLVLFSQVIFRYVFNNSLDWPDELSRFLLIWLTFLGMTIATWHKNHLLIDFFKKLLPFKLGRTITYLIYTLVILFFIIAFLSSFKAIKLSFGISLVSLPFSWGHAFISFPVGAAICILYYVNFIVNKRVG